MSDFEYDCRTRREIVADKYGLSEAEIATYEVRMNAGEHIAIASVETQKELGLDITVIDRRPTFMGQDTEVKAVPKPALKYPEKTYGKFQPILDRILIKRCAENKDMELLADGSVMNKKTGLIIAARYRQHSNVGVVLATGKFVILGGQRIAMDEVVRVGDRVTYGDYNSEILVMSEDRVVTLCDDISFNYFDDEDGLRVVRVQDVRGVEHEVPHDANLMEFVKGYGGTTSASGTTVFARAEGNLLTDSEVEAMQNEGGNQCKTQN
jgi:co-chaperonin GroES (HSP10)